MFNEDNVLGTDTGTAEYESEVEVNSKTILGYKYDHKSADTIKIDTENNVAYVYYEKLYTYTVEYYFNGVKNDNYTISSETLANVSISFDRPETLDGYTYISYVGFDGILNGSMTTTTGTNIIRVDYGKAVTTIQKEATQSVNAGEEIEYTINNDRKTITVDHLAINVNRLDNYTSKQVKIYVYNNMSYIDIIN